MGEQESLESSGAQTQGEQAPLHKLFSKCPLHVHKKDWGQDKRPGIFLFVDENRYKTSLT